MPGQPPTHVIDQQATFGTVFYMACSPRLAYVTGPDGKRQPSGEQEVGTVSGKKKWNVQTTGLSPDGERQHPLKVGMEADTDPTEGLTPGTPVVFDQLELGVMIRDDGGAQLWYRAQGIHALTPANGQGKATATAASGKQENH